MESLLGNAANCPVLVWRSSVVDAVLQLVDRTCQGSGGSMRLSGEAGLGKSRLVAVLRTYAIAHGFLCSKGTVFRPMLPAPTRR